MAIPKAYSQKSIGPAAQKFWQRTFIRYAFVFLIIGLASFTLVKKIYSYASYLKVLKSIGISEPSGFSLRIGRQGHAAQTPSPPVSAGSTQPNSTNATKPSESAILTSAGGSVAAGTTQPLVVEKDPTQPPKNFDPLSISSEQEIKLLQNLAERRKVLDKREEEIVKKERALEVSKKEVLEKLADLEKVKKAVESTLQQIDKTEKDKFARLIKLFEGMKPKEAAKIFNQMDIKTLKDLFLVIGEKKLSLIMATMNPIKAKEVTGLLISQKNIFAAEMNESKDDKKDGALIPPGGSAAGGTPVPTPLPSKTNAPVSQPSPAGSLPATPKK